MGRWGMGRGVDEELFTGVILARKNRWNPDMSSRSLADGAGFFLREVIIGLSFYAGEEKSDIPRLSLLLHVAFGGGDCSPLLYGLITLPPMKREGNAKMGSFPVSQQDFSFAFFQGTAMYLSPSCVKRYVRVSGILTFCQMRSKSTSCLPSLDPKISCC